MLIMLFHFPNMSRLRKEANFIFKLGYHHTMSSEQQQSLNFLPLKEVDPDLYSIIEKEKNRQLRGLELIASEVSN